MREQTALLFDEFAAAYRRGEAPDVLAFVERAGEDADALAALLDRFLQAVPARPPTEEELVLMDARLTQEPPLLVLRRRRGLTRAAVVDAIVSTLGLDLKKRDKVAGYYHELEVGILDPKPVSAKLWAALDRLLEANVRVLAGLRLPPAVARARYLRADADVRFSLGDAPVARIDALLESLPEAVPAEPAPERDEIDRLFTGAS